MLRRGVAVFAEVDAEKPGALLCREIIDEALEAGAVEAHAVDNGLLPRQTEHALFWVPWLRARRDGAELQPAETEIEQRAQGLGILVQTGGEAHGIGKIQTHDAHRQRRGARGIQGMQQAAGTGNAVQPAQQREGQVVAGFGIQGKQQGADQRVQRSSSVAVSGRA